MYMRLEKKLKRLFIRAKFTITNFAFINHPCDTNESVESLQILLIRFDKTFKIGNSFV